MNKWTLPIKTEWMKSQMEHESSRSYAEEIYNLVKEFPYKNALEIGAAWGLSTLAILLAQDKGNLLSVDPDETIKTPEEIKQNGLEDRWTWVESRSNKFWENNKDIFDIIYIDGSHLYDDVHLDLHEGWKVLKNGGLMFLDDITHKANKTGEYGVSLAAWQHIVNNNITKIETTTRLLYFKK